MAATEEENLTADNCSELANLLALKDPTDPSVSAFAETYKNKTIEFDGCILAMQNHGSYDTRYDILIGAGDFNPDSAQGPNFRLTDVGAYDMNLDTLWVTDVLSTGTNVHITAKVKEYDSETTIFELDSVEVKTR